MGALLLVFPNNALVTVSALGLSAVAVAWWELRVLPRLGGTVFLIASGVMLLLPASWSELAVSPYKGLPQALNIFGTKIVDQRSSPLGLLTTVESPAVPWRHVSGLSLTATQEPPPQIAVFTDADAMTVITKPSSNPAAMAYLDQITSALPYHLAELSRVLILGAGGGSDVLQALHHKVPRIDAVELNPQLADLVRTDFADFSGGLYRQPGVQLHIDEARGYVARSAEQFDLIQLALMDSFAASSAGLYALSESYLYTVEAFSEYLAHVAPGGYLAITGWVNLPPRDTLKMFATAVAALEHVGVPDPGRRLVLIRSWQTSTLLVKSGEFTVGEIAAVRAFCNERGFDLGYYTGIQPDEGNRYNILESPYFVQGTLALLGDQRDEFLAQYKFDLQPATDDRPYFFHFFKWSGLQEMLALRKQGGMALLEWSYLVLVGTLLQAVVLSVVLIVLPLLFVRQSKKNAVTGVNRLRVFTLFFALGLAFLFVEIAFIQRFILFLHHPLYATAVVVTAFLIFAGLGSAYAQRMAPSNKRRRAMLVAVAGILILGGLYTLTFGAVLQAALTWSFAAKFAFTLAAIAPLAFCMGLPFPLALNQLSANAPTLLPWAWGVNGCASVISAVLAMLIAIHWGFTVVILLALALYAVAAMAFSRRDDLDQEKGLTPGVP